MDFYVCGLRIGRTQQQRCQVIGLLLSSHLYWGNAGEIAPAPDAVVQKTRIPGGKQKHLLLPCSAASAGNAFGCNLNRVRCGGLAAN